MTSRFTDFFRRATGRDPYPYQERFAGADGWPHLLRAPTGAGKTATAVLGWLYRWRERKPGTPRRLVYCLPMRVLVEQSSAAAEQWISKLVEEQVLPEAIRVHRLMGGVEAEDWHLHPERPAVLIGTQDMLLSRALNRGYAASRFHWPIDFGLLNTDCLWVFDEPQLMASGVSTSAQLAGLRASLGTWADRCPSVWMSATLEPGWLDTVDFRGKFDAPPFELHADDFAHPQLKKVMEADKTLRPLGVSSARDMKDAAKAVWAKHEAGTQTLVVLNTVDRAKAVYEELRKLRKKADAPRLLLVHSRFRPHEREKLNAELQAKGDAAKDRIIVATQVVEAGVDISARTLVTELAPWASVVQRLGRCNRTGGDGTRDDPARAFWIDLDDPSKLGAPYEPDELKACRERLAGELNEKDVSPKALSVYRLGEFEHRHVLRRRDLLDLFDTAPDLSGNDIDIARFVRGDDPDADVQVFWRQIGADGPGEDEPEPDRRELCNVPVGQARDFLDALADKKRGTGYVWDHIDEGWVKAERNRVRPGVQILLPTTAGGYSGLGWDPDSTAAVEPLPPPPEEEPKPPEGTGDDPNAAIPVALTITEHTENVCRRLARAGANDPAGILDELADVLPDGWRSRLADAARWHDVGKGLPVCQKAMHASPTPDPTRLLAKSGRKGRLHYDKYGRPHFRHELGSALAVLGRHPEWPFAVAYLIAAHHGRVRLSIRAVPGEESPEPEKAFALGVRQGDPLPEVDLGGGVTCPATTLDLSPMRLGGEASWTARALRLLAELGPFRLGYLEAVLRAADVRASRDEAKGVTGA
jgi:CRISPR-associated endonuclease/helicase Cas3